MTEPTRIALVTGASRGLGLVIARVLGSRGYRLVIGGRDRDALAAAAGELSRHAPAVLPGGRRHHRCRRCARRLIDAARQLGGLNVLVNNASELGAIGPLSAFDVPRFGRLFPVNVGAPMVLMQLALPLLDERRGLIVNITSDAATAAYPGWGPYGATKAALELLTRTLAAELRDQGVSAILVDPGDMRTRMHQEAFPGEDISDRPLPEVTVPFWNWLFDQDPDADSRPAVRGATGGCAMAAAGVIDAFTLPAHLEAAEPPEARGLTRDDVRLLVSRIDTDSISHSRFSELPRWLSPGDLLVVNTSGTLKAALPARTRDGHRFELHLSTRLPGNFWVVEVRRPGPVASLPYRARARGDRVRAGRRRPHHAARAVPACRRAGRTVAICGSRRCSLPNPCCRTSNTSAARFDTATSRRRGRTRCTRRSSPLSRAAPRCHPQAVRSLPELVTRLVASGIQIAPLLLHTGVASLEDHEPPYEEYFRVPPETADRVNAARRAGHRVVAVGTTVVRALETVTDNRGITSPGEGWTESRDHARTTAARGDRHDYRLPRTARHASRDRQTGHSRGWRRTHRPRTSSAPTLRRNRPDICGTSSGTHI